MGRWGGWTVLGIALALAGGLVVSTPVTNWRGRADEGAYLRYAARIASDGLGILPSLVHGYLADPTLRAESPAPLRVSVLIPDALAVHWGGERYESLQRVSLAAFLALIVVAFLSVRHHPGATTAAALVLLLAASPLQLAMARRALSDSLNAALWTASLALCIEAMVAEWRRGWLLVALAFAATLLVKELNVIIVPVALALLAVDGGRRGRLPSAWALVGVAILPLTLSAAAIAAAAGGIQPAIDALRALTSQAGENTYGLQFGSGPWFRYVVDFLLVSPWTTLLYVVWLGLLVAERGDDRRLVAWALVPLLFVAAVSPTLKFIRWALPLDVPIRLGAVLAVQRLVGDRPGRPWGTVRLAVVIAALVAVDLASFQTLFVAADIYDPSSPLLLWWRGFLPR